MNAAGLAAWIEHQLGDELASRQEIAETALAGLKEIATRPAGDQRVTAAAQFLAGARRRKGSTLPPSVLVREDAELRRQLGQVLDYVTEAQIRHAVADSGVQPDGSAVLAPADLIEVLGALDHAAAFLADRAAQWCDDCTRHPAGACETHVDDLDQADTYRALTTRLGGGQ